MAKKRVYAESSVISYLAAKPSRDIAKLAKQRHTREWWERRGRWDLFISQAAMDEITRGDPQAANARREKASLLALLPNAPEAMPLAKSLMARIQIPLDSAADAAHLALAAFHQMDYMVTWNQRHLDNPILRERINAVIRERKLRPAAVLTPERLLEMDDDGR